jgi:hypothetical protein
MNAMQSLERPAFYFEAREYADRVGIESLDELERVRLSMCYREFTKRMEPWIRQLADIRALSLADTPEFRKALEVVREMSEHEAHALGLQVS